MANINTERKIILWKEMKQKRLLKNNLLRVFLRWTDKTKDVFVLFVAMVQVKKAMVLEEYLILILTNVSPAVKPPIFST